jgi:acetyl esterase/lipase
MSYAFDPELLQIIELLPSPDLNDLDAARVAIDDLLSGFPEPDTEGMAIDDRTVPGPDGAPDITVRVYRSSTAPPTTAAVLYLHGGGFVLGSIDTEHVPALEMARALGVVVVSVEYRLAPEHPFPAGVEDCYAGLVWLHDNAASLGVDPDRIAVLGRSAGGGLAAAVALLARDRQGPPLCLQVLDIPELDDRLETASMRAFVDTPLWNRPSAEISWRAYLGSGDGSGEVSPYAAPARAKDLAGLPPAYVATMEFDPLRDEGIIYALRLLQAGVSVELHSYPGTFHGSALVPTAGVSMRAMADEVVALRRRLGLDVV